MAAREATSGKGDTKMAEGIHWGSKGRFRGCGSVRKRALVRMEWNAVRSLVLEASCSERVVRGES